MAKISGTILVPSSASGSSHRYRDGDPYGPTVNRYNQAIMDDYWATYGQNQLVLGSDHRKGFAYGIQTDGPMPVESSEVLHERAAFPNKDFVQRQRRGEIVVSPYESRAIQITSKPGWLSAQNERFGPSFGWFSSFDIGLPSRVGSCYPVDPWASKKYIQHLLVFTQMKGEYDVIKLDPDLVLSDLLPKEEINKSIVTSALAEANSGTYDLLTEVAELPETLRYLIGILRDFASALKAVRKREVEVKKLFRNKKQTERTAYELADALASVWLQFRYAISPLGYSFNDVITTLEEYKRVFAKYRQRQVDYAEPVKISGLDILSHDDFITSHKVFIKRSFSPEDIVDALLSLLKVNPLATAYELIPLSFVVDWFLNIGDYITAMTGTISYSQEAATYSWKTEGNVTYGMNNILPDGYRPPTVNLSYRTYKRIVIDPKAHTGLSYDPFINWKRQLDALALLWGPTKKMMKGL